MRRIAALAGSIMVLCAWGATPSRDIPAPSSAATGATATYSGPVSSGTTFVIAGKSQMSSAADGYVDLYNNAASGLLGLRLGGLSASYPMLKVSGTTLAHRLADDSADAPMSAGNITASGPVLVPSGAWTYTGAASPSVGAGEVGTGIGRVGAGIMGVSLGAKYAFSLNLNSIDVEFHNQAADSYAAGFKFFSGRSGSTALVFDMDASNGVVSYSGLAAATTNGANGIIATNGAVSWQGVDAHAAYGISSGTSNLTAALSGASVAVSGAIPAGSVVVGVTTRVITTITGATTFSIGDGTAATAFGNAIATAAGTTTSNSNWTLTTTPVYPAGAAIVLTANGGAFTGGQVRVNVYYTRCFAPTG